MTPDAPLAPDEPEFGTPPPPPGHPRSQSQSLRQLSDRTPLRTKLITAVLVLVIAALAAIGVASTYMLHSYLIHQHDADITSSMGGAISQVEATGQLPRHVNPGYASPTQSSVVLGVQVPGSQLKWQVVPDLPGLGMPGVGSQDSLPMLPTASDWAGKNLGDSEIISETSQNGPNTWRVMAVTVSLNNNAGQTSPATLIAAVDLGNIGAVTRQLVLFDLVVGGGIVLVLAIVAIWIVRANLRPLDDIELTAGQIAAGHLNHRIAERDPRTEIGSLGRSLNAMLSQIETAFHAQQKSEEAAHRSEERMRRFIADASHELRTPLTTLRGFAEFYRQRGGVQPDGMTPEEVDRIMRRLESEASRMGLLVEDLLQLARLDQQRPLDIHPVDLLTLAADAVQDARMVAPERKIELTVAPGAAFLVEGDEPRLRQVIGNLVANARTHTPPEASITVSIASGTLESGAPAVVLDVIDDGPGMTAEQAQHIFERFYRADAARNRASGGTGLGLAIVAGLLAAHGGEVSVRTAPGQGADFRVRLPLSADALYPDELSRRRLRRLLVPSPEIRVAGS